ncbi:MAG: ribonuclease HII [bacterium]|nr:ribonuclease HII [bacterium]
MSRLQRLPDFSYEKKLWRQGYEIIIGIDEVGRGSFAGPVVAAAVAWPPKFKIENLKLKIGEDLEINDSKQLKPKEREKLSVIIKEEALAWDITEVGVSVINRIGIGKATEKAMRKAIADIAKLLIANCSKKQSTINYKQSNNMFVLVDGFHVKYLRGIGLKNQKGVIHGDQKSISIAAASILAKVHRDKLMQSLSKQSKYKKYGWEKNKGYGTKEHQNAILKYGLTRLHRKAFVKTWEEKRRGEKHK